MNHFHPDKYVKIYKGTHVSKIKKVITPFRISDAQRRPPFPFITAHEVGVLNEKRCKKVIVLDIDETLGAFKELNVLWKCIEPIAIDRVPLAIHSRFNELLDLYPEFLRYGILQIFHYLYQKKVSGDCYKLYIYTNNQCINNWVSLLLNYFTYKTMQQYITTNIQNIELFDQVIYAFKINNKPIEVRRTTHSKTYRDFIQCTMLPQSTELCFVDNTYFPEMKNEKVYYIQPLSYSHCLSVDEICGRIIVSPLWTDALKHGITEKNIRESFYYYREPRINKVEQFRLNMAVAQKMMFHIKEFFLFNTFHQKTKKRKLRNTGRTTKKSAHRFGL